jgi:hypothetical protein
MRQLLLIILICFVASSICFTQNRAIARGAEEGELYMRSLWKCYYDIDYGPPFYDTARMALYHITEHGKKLTIPYDADIFANPENIMIPEVLIADATPGVVYNKQTYHKNGYSHTALWISFDAGKTWTFREENSYATYYAGASTVNNESIIYRGGGYVF